ncbi:MAG TPA: cytochrome c [Terriglobales bacterium]|nr:cytochrome c [Terriglobales bacterium]
MYPTARDWLIFLLVSVLIGAVGVSAAGGQTGAGTLPSNPPAASDQQSVDPTSGKQLYGAYCALCHGPDGKGGGPFSPQLKVPPPDLTQLLKNNHGLYPEMRVREAIDGEFAKPSHGSSEMPIWGPVFREMAHGKRDSAQVRINSLVKYLESIQQR